MDAVSDPAERNAFELQIMEFGQTPRLLFSVPHPQRKLAAACACVYVRAYMRMRVRMCVSECVCVCAFNADSSHSTHSQHTLTTHLPSLPCITWCCRRLPSVPRPFADASDAAQSTRGAGTGDGGDGDVASAVQELSLDVPLVVEPKGSGETRVDDAPTTATTTTVSNSSSSGGRSWSDMAELQHTATLSIHRDGITALALSRDANTLYSASQVCACLCVCLCVCVFVCV